MEHQALERLSVADSMADRLFSVPDSLGQDCERSQRYPKDCHQREEEGARNRALRHLERPKSPRRHMRCLSP
jgi:hypothetical protein